MTLKLQPVRVATGSDEEGVLVFDEEQRLLAVLTHLSDQYDGLSGHWFLEAKFGVLEGLGQPTYPELEAAQEATAQHLAKRR